MKVYANYLELKEEVLELVKHLYAHQLWLPVYKDDEYHPVGRMEAGKDISGIIRYTSLSHRWLSGAASLRDFTVRPFLRLIPQPITLKEEAFEEYQRRLRKDWEYAKNTIIPHFQREDKP